MSVLTVSVHPLVLLQWIADYLYGCVVTDESEMMSEKLVRLQNEADSYRQYNRRTIDKFR